MRPRAPWCALKSGWVAASLQEVLRHRGSFPGTPRCPKTQDSPSLGSPWLGASRSRIRRFGPGGARETPGVPGFPPRPCTAAAGDIVPDPPGPLCSQPRGEGPLTGPGRRLLRGCLEHPHPGGASTPLGGPARRRRFWGLEQNMGQEVSGFLFLLIYLFV